MRVQISERLYSSKLVVYTTIVVVWIAIAIALTASNVALQDAELGSPCAESVFAPAGQDTVFCYESGDSSTSRKTRKQKTLQTVNFAKAS